ncbi:zwei Ig domain protein zig-8-like [Athalia rosae]|uniref:zwei Ig domain protein zig-8-like n=1 Tax=Athalia rosae TaxID=37344 RepID=UPI0020336335|nr:zwei Ig domain protein zig-8-like [Athalia rosae]XP_048511717.1 zwei Ig domain protein zig-8-like [Athalia rosae]
MRARHNDYGATTIVLVFVFFINVMLQIESLAGIMADGVEKIGQKTEDGSQEFIENDVKPLMNFGTNNSTVIVAQTGSTALIPCVVQNMGDSMVSWIRRKGVQQLLTVGLTTYASDERFQAIHFQHSEDWTLQIKYVQQRDAGIYECQVSTHPPSSIFLLLQVVDAHTEIDGPLEKYFRPDSNLLLHCVVKKSTEIPSYLFWYHNTRMVNYDTDRGYNISTDLTGKESWLEISRATIRHSGNYTCEASNAKSTRVLIHVFNGDNPAAMQHSSALSSFSKNNFLHKNNIILVISVVIIRSILNAIHIRKRPNFIVR